MSASSPQDPGSTAAELRHGGASGDGYGVRVSVRSSYLATITKIWRDWRRWDRRKEGGGGSQLRTRRDVSRQQKGISKERDRTTFTTNRISVFPHRRKSFICISDHAHQLWSGQCTALVSTVKTRAPQDTAVSPAVSRMSSLAAS